jgi:hypothetical protein
MMTTITWPICNLIHLWPERNPELMRHCKKVLYEIKKNNKPNTDNFELRIYTMKLYADLFWVRVVWKGPVKPIIGMDVQSEYIIWLQDWRANQLIRTSQQLLRLSFSSTAVIQYLVELGTSAIRDISLFVT